MSKKAIVPGTFDPITNGHKEIIAKAACMFDEVIVAVAKSHKQTMFSLDTRTTLAAEVLSELDNVTVKSFDNLLVDFARDNDCKIIVRGLRVVSDFEYELQLANMNRNINKKIETVFLTASPDNSFISSSLVKDVASHHGDITKFVPKEVAVALKSKK